MFNVALSESAFLFCDNNSLFFIMGMVLFLITVVLAVKILQLAERGRKLCGEQGSFGLFKVIGRW